MHTQIGQLAEYTSEDVDVLIQFINRRGDYRNVSARIGLLDSSQFADRNDANVMTYLENLKREIYAYGHLPHEDKPHRYNIFRAYLGA